jgi:hypothetical protein
LKFKSRYHGLYRGDNVFRSSGTFEAPEEGSPTGSLVKREMEVGKDGDGVPNGLRALGVYGGEVEVPKVAGVILCV